MGPKNLTEFPVSDECRDWLDQTFLTLNDKVTRQAAPQRSQLTQRHRAPRSDGRCPDDAVALYDAVLSGKYGQALDLCHKALACPDVGVRGIYPVLVMPAIRMVGQAWADDSASFEQTALAFSLLHRLLDRLAQEIAPGRLRDISRKLQAAQQRIMVAVAPGDSHSFGAMILTQELRLRGWLVTFYDHQHSDSVIAALTDEGFDTLAISVSCDESLAGLSEFITTCRMANRAPQHEILIGGAAIQAPFGQYDFLQADRVGLGIEEVVSFLSSREIERHRGKWN